MTEEENKNAIIPFSANGSAKADETSSKLPAKVHLMVVETGDVIVRSTEQTLILGRQGSGRPADVDLTDFQAHQLGVSRHHIQIEVSGSRLMVRDLNSTNGSRLNGEKLKPMYVYELHHGDVIKLGRMHVRVYFVED